MANYDERIVLGAMADVASAKKTGEEIGRAAGNAATNAFLDSFKAVYSAIPKEHNGKTPKKGYYLDEGAQKAIAHITSIAGDTRVSGQVRRVAMQQIINATKEWMRKGAGSIDQQISAAIAISSGQTAINESRRADAFSKNYDRSQKISRAKLTDAYKSAVESFYSAKDDLESAVEKGDSTDIAFARKKYEAAAKYIRSRRFKDVAETVDIKKAEEVEKEHIRALSKNTQAMLYLNTAVAAVGAGAQMVAAFSTSFMQQHVDRNVFGSVAAYNSRVKAAGTIGGGVAGTLLGGILGATLGPGGALIGAQLGGTVGGALGGLPGTALEKAFQGKQRTIQDFQSRIRANNMYRGAYSVSFGGMVQEMGMASAGDVENMVGNSQTLGARMMFGQVGENEMLMYSLMPNYFAAAMAGASDAELAAAYARDLKALPPMMRLWAGSTVGGGSAGMAAFAQDPFFNKVLANAGKGHWIDQMMVAYSGAWQGGSVQRGLANAELAWAEGGNATAVTKDEIGIFDSSAGLRPVFAHTKPQYGAVPIANSIDLQRAYANGQIFQTSYEDVFQNTGYLFNEMANLINKRTPEEYAKFQERMYGQWGPNESKNFVIQVYVGDQKAKEIQVRGEQAAKAGKMSVYSEIGY